jgi:cytidylate kinase
MGSGGSYVGYLLAQELGYKYVDREILRQAAKHLGKDVSWLENYDGKSSGIIANLLKAFCFGAPEILGTQIELPVYDRDLFTLESRIMNDIAGSYNAVIIGRGGFRALKDHPRMLRVFIHAPLEFRAERLMKAQRLTDTRKALAMVRDSDQQRARFLRDMVGIDWTDATNYHLCIDTSLVSFSASVNMLRKLVEMLPEEQ